MPTANAKKSEPLVDELVSALRAVGTRARAEQERKYLKSELEHFGVTVPAIRTIAKQARKAHPELGERRALTQLVEALWAPPVHERRMLAIELLTMGEKLLVAEDLKVIERLLRDSQTWAFVDSLAVNVAGPLVERAPALTRTLDRWARDPNFWIRRSAMLALLIPLRRGEGDFARFSGYADAMLEEKEFFIRKAIGWILRETSKKQPEVVYDWLLPRVERASGVTLREAEKYLSAKQRETLRTRRR